MKDQKIKFEPHPVSPERKAELRAAGYTIIDAVFAPPQAAKADAKPEAPAVPHKTSKAK